MLSASILVPRYAYAYVQDYENVLIQLEQSFAQYEAGRTSIVAYLEAVNELAHHVRRRRALRLWLCDWIAPLHWLNRAERRAFRDMLEALEWCRAWALRQRGDDVASCLEVAGANFQHTPGEPRAAAT